MPSQVVCWSGCLVCMFGCVLVCFGLHACIHACAHAPQTLLVRWIYL